nr:unnamed protein product [Digitaria exilis]
MKVIPSRARHHHRAGHAKKGPSAYCRQGRTRTNEQAKSVGSSRDLFSIGVFLSSSPRQLRPSSFSLTFYCCTRETDGAGEGDRVWCAFFLLDLSWALGSLLHPPPSWSWIPFPSFTAAKRPNPFRRPSLFFPFSLSLSLGADDCTSGAAFARPGLHRPLRRRRVTRRYARPSYTLPAARS